MSRLRRALYYGAFGGTVVMMAGVGYTLYSDLRYLGGKYPVIEEAIERLEHDPQVVQLMGGLPFQVHGEGRRRPQVQKSWMGDGRKCLESRFWLQGANAANLAEVEVRVVEGEDQGGWVPKHLTISIPGKKPALSHRSSFKSVV